MTAGCERWSRTQSISFQRLRVETANETKQVSGSVAVRSQGPDGWRTFHDVSVVAYDQQGEQINSTTLGDVTGTTRDVEFSLSCKRRPERIVVEATESPCDADTSMDEYVYAGRNDDGTRMWEQRERECES